MTSFLRTLFKAPVMGPVASPTANSAVCDSEGFYQHLGECWNDSIQMIFLFSDGLKEIVQPALLDPNFDSKVESIINRDDNNLLFTFITDLSGLKTTNLGAANNPFENSSNRAILDSKVSERKKAIIDYFKVLKKRFMRHYTNEHIRRHSLCDEETANEHSVFETMSQISRAAGQDGISAAALGHINTKGVNRSHINIEELRKKKEEKKYSPGGSSIDDEYLFNLYKLVFFDGYKFSYTIVDPPFEKIADYVGIRLSMITKDLIKRSKAVYISSYVYKRVDNTLEFTRGHATAFYNCGKSEVYYDDNTGIYPFPWKEFLLKAVELYKNDKNTRLLCGINEMMTQTSSYYPIIRTGKWNDNEFLNKEERMESYTYYTFIDDSPLLESKDGNFKYNGILISVPDTDLRSVDTLIFMTINNDQAVNAQRFNHTARHGSINFDYLYRLIEQPNPDAEKILQFFNEYIQSNNFKHYEFFKENLSYGISRVLKGVRPMNTLLNNKLLELAEAYLDPTDVEKLRKLAIPYFYPNLPPPRVKTRQPQTPTPPNPQPWPSRPFFAKGQSPQIGGYRKKRKTRHRKQSIKRKTLKKQKL